MIKNGNRTEQEYEFDLQGNRTSLKETIDGTTTVTAYEYGKNNRLKKETVANETPQYYNYDNNGNMTSKTIGGSLTSLTYDTLNRMTSHSVLRGYMDTYTYYPDNMRKSKGRDGSMTQIWMNDEIALDARGASVQSSYIHGNKLISSAYGWYLYNAHGDVIALTDDVGDVTYNYEYDPYGVEMSEPSTYYSMNPYRYCGEYFDAETGFTYLRARYYDAKSGRFISEDPALDGLNWYAYCNNNPINYIDPTGYKATTFEKYFNKKYKKIVNYQYAPTKVKLKGNKVAISSVIQIEGAKASRKKEIKRGIEKKWSGTVKIAGYKVSVKTTILEAKAGQCSHYLSYKKGAGTSNVDFAIRGKWTDSESHSITIYSKFSNGNTRTKSDIENTAAHEFGHILGIDDAYLYNESKYAPKNSIIRWYNDVSNTKMNTYDVLLCLKAFAYGKFRSWSQFEKK